MPAFRVEVTGRWRDPALQIEEETREVFVVAAPGPDGARVAGVQLFGGAAARRRMTAMPGPAARVLGDGE
jgi:hypothetical protein